MRRTEGFNANDPFASFDFEKRAEEGLALRTPVWSTPPFEGETVVSPVELPLPTSHAKRLRWSLAVLTAASTSTSGCCRAPLGMIEAQGMMLPLWEDVVPNVPDEELAEAAQRIAAAM